MNRFDQTTALLLAGGLGTRLRPALADRPKPLAPVNGRPFVTYLLDQLAAAGLRRCILCTGYRGEQIEAALGDTYRGMALAYSQEAQPLGTGGAIRLGMEQADTPTVLVLNGDSYFDADLPAFAAWAEAKEAAAALLLRQVDDTARYGRVEADESGRVRDFVEKEAAGGPGWINAGIYRLSRTLIDTMPPGAFSIERDWFPAQVERGLYGRVADGAFLDIGTPASYRQAEAFFREMDA